MLHVTGGWALAYPVAAVTAQGPVPISSQGDPTHIWEQGAGGEGEGPTLPTQEPVAAGSGHLTGTWPSAHRGRVRASTTWLFRCGLLSPVHPHSCPRPQVKPRPGVSQNKQLLLQDVVLFKGPGAGSCFSLLVLRFYSPTQELVTTSPVDHTCLWL